MQKPNDYDDVQEYGENRQLEPGGHILIIKKVEETTSSTGKPMLIINFDTADRDKQPRFFKQKYDNGTREAAKKTWGGRYWQLVYDTDGKTTNRGFKTFITAVEKSNSSSFKVKWGDKFCECFKDKLVGGVFRREEFIGSNGKPAMAVKCMGFRSVAAIDEGVEVPEDKLLDGSTSGGYPVPDNAPRPVVNNTDDSGDDDDYPF